MKLISFYFDPRGRISRKDFWLKLVLVTAVVQTLFYSAEATYQTYRSGSPELLLQFAIDFKYPPWARIQATSADLPFQSAFALLWFWPPIAVSVKRLHDLGLSAWWLAAYAALGVVVQVIGNFGLAFGLLQSMDGSFGLLWYVLMALTIAGVIATPVIGLFPGQDGPNRYGLDPLEYDAEQEAVQEHQRNTSQEL